VQVLAAAGCVAGQVPQDHVSPPPPAPTAAQLQVVGP
jgi:hypothetical protein